MKGLPTRCIDPVMKCCQDCAWGYREYGFDKGRPEDEPTDEELQKFDEWMKNQLKENEKCQ